MGYQVTRDNEAVVLPPFGVDLDETDGIDVTTWHDTIENVHAFVARHAPHATPDRYTGLFPRPVPTRAVLVHRSDNTYNSNAIGVSRPKAAGGTKQQRHLGYLSDGTLYRLGRATLPDLIGFAGGEVEVTVLITGPEHLVLDVPEAWPLSEAIEEFLAGHGIVTAGHPGRPTKPRLVRHRGNHRLTKLFRRHLAGSRPRRTPTQIRVAALLGTDPAERILSVSDADSGHTVGTIRGGILLLDDERDRDTVVGLLNGLGVDVTGPVTDPTVPEDGTWPADAVPDVKFRRRTGGLDLRVHAPAADHDDTFAIFNPTTRTLWVEDSTLVAPALRYLHRSGIDPAAVGLPGTAWGLESEIHFRDLYDRSAAPEDITHNPATHPTLSRAVRSLLPSGILASPDVTWKRRIERRPGRPAPADLLAFERFVRQRTVLFPEHTLTGNETGCRLCGGQAVEFTTPVSLEPVAYCHRCLVCATIGVVTDPTRRANAVRELSRLEFDGQPMLADQTIALHRNPAEPVASVDIDRSVLVRFAIPRRAAWTLLLEAAGFAEEGLRTSRGTLIRSRDGHLCLSLREKAVCDFLHLHGIEHDREPRYPADPDYNPTGLRRADWVLRDGTLVELWGLPNDPAYAAKIVDKRALAARHGLRLVEIYDADLPHLPELFGDWLGPAAGPAWTWSPALVQLPATAQKNQERAAKGPGADHNAHVRDERLRRCEQAVKLQADGLTRAEVAAELGVGMETVQMLLRDGKFYARPGTDPARVELAHAAHTARTNGQTRDQFRSTRRLSAAKAHESWRDGDVLFGASGPGAPLETPDDPQA